MKARFVFWFALIIALMFAIGTAMGQTKSITLERLNASNQFEGIVGYYGPAVIIRGQWGPAFVNVLTGQVWGPDQVTNCEFPGAGRYPCPVHLDVHSCCGIMGLAGGKLYVLADRGGMPQDGSTLIYQPDPPTFLGVSSDPIPATFGPQASDPNGFTWRLDYQGTFATGFLVMLRSDTPGPTPAPNPTEVPWIQPTTIPTGIASVTVTPGGTICGPTTSGQCYDCRTFEFLPCPESTRPTATSTPAPPALSETPTGVPSTPSPTPTSAPSVTSVPTADYTPSASPVPTLTASIPPTTTPASHGSAGGCGKNSSASLSAGLVIGLMLYFRKKGHV